MLARFFNKTLTDTVLIHCLSALGLSKQYVAITQKACDQIEILKEDALSELKLMSLQDMGIRKEKGIALAGEIEVKIVEKVNSLMRYWKEDSYEQIFGINSMWYTREIIRIIKGIRL